MAAGTAGDLKATAGQQTIEVRAPDRFRAAEVADIVTRLTGARPELRPETGLVTATATDPVMLPELVRRLDVAGIVAAAMALRLAVRAEPLLRLPGRLGWHSPGTSRRRTRAAGDRAACRVP